MEYHPGADKHFRDDLLGQKLVQLRTKLGEKGNLLVIIDACHSGTMTRGVGRTKVGKIENDYTFRYRGDSNWFSIV